MTSSTVSRIGLPTGTWHVDKSRSRVGFAVISDKVQIVLDIAAVREV